MCFPAVLLVALVSQRLLQAYHGTCLGIDSETSFEAMSFFGEEGHLLWTASLNVIGTA